MSKESKVKVEKVKKTPVHVDTRAQWRAVNLANVKDVLSDKDDSISARDVRSPIFTSAPFEMRGKAWSKQDLAKLAKLKAQGYSNVYCAATLHRPICAIESRGIKMKSVKALTEREQKVESDYLKACARAFKAFKAK